MNVRCKASPISMSACELTMAVWQMRAKADHNGSRCARAKNGVHEISWKATMLPGLT